MAVTLVGEIVNSCDAVTGFNQGNISTDDDNVEGTGAIGLKASNALFRMYTTTLGATAPYDFSSGGGESGDHIIMWFNTKSPVSAVGGLRVIVGDTVNGSRAEWYVDPVGFYKGGFITQVQDTASDFDVIELAGTTAWTTTGNPAQLTNIDQMGGAFNTITSIMGNFNNVQLDQITIGKGVRVDGGTVGVPNTFEVVRAADEDTNFWGWWSSAFGSFIGKGKLFIGPATGSAVSVFTDSAGVVIFADAQVAIGHYEINTRGAGTDVTLTGMVIAAENPINARWTLTVDSTTLTYLDNGSLYQGFDTLTLDSTTDLNDTTLDNGESVVQNGATLDGCVILNANTADGVALITSNNPAEIKNCNFTFSDGHAIEIDTAGTYTFTGNKFTGYGGTPGSNLTPSSGSTDAAIYNNSGGAVTINVAGGGDTPSVRNGASATTTVNNNVSVTLTGMKDNTEVRVFESGTTTVVDGIENATAGTADDRSFTFSDAASDVVDIRIFNKIYEVADIIGFTVPTVDTSIPIQQRFDRNYSNP